MNICLCCLFSSLSSNFHLCFRSQAARGKEKDKEGTTESGIKLEPVPGLPGGKGVVFISETLNADELLREAAVKPPRAVAGIRTVEALVSPEQFLTVGLQQIQLGWEVSFAWKQILDEKRILYVMSEKLKLN